MSRNIVTLKDIQLAKASAGAAPQIAGGGVQQPTPQADNYQTKLMKYIPAEVVALYVFMEAVVRTSALNADQIQQGYWIIFVVSLIGTPLYLWRFGKVSKLLQLIVSAGAFVVWVFALGGPFESMEWYQNNQLYPALILPIYTFFVAAIDPK